MPYSDPQKQREYQRQWVDARRSEYMADKTCRRCGTTERLELHHRDPAQKITHRIWTWSAARRKAELAKCVIVCRPCHELIHWPEGTKAERARAERAAAAEWLAEWDRRKAARRTRRAGKSVRTGDGE